MELTWVLMLASKSPQKALSMANGVPAPKSPCKPSQASPPQSRVFPERPLGETSGIGRDFLDEPVSIRETKGIQARYKLSQSGPARYLPWRVLRNCWMETRCESVMPTMKGGRTGITMRP